MSGNRQWMGRPFPRSTALAAIKSLQDNNQLQQGIISSMMNSVATKGNKKGQTIKKSLYKTIAAQSKTGRTSYGGGCRRAEERKSWCDRTSELEAKNIVKWGKIKPTAKTNRYNFTAEGKQFNANFPLTDAEKKTILENRQRIRTLKSEGKAFNRSTRQWVAAAEKGNLKPTKKRAREEQKRQGKVYNRSLREWVEIGQQGVKKARKARPPPKTARR